MSDGLGLLFGAGPGSGHRPGVCVGVVTNVADPEGLGRVKVALPWLGEGIESGWARVVTPMAGAGRGLYCLPEVDDEVLLAFEHGDPASVFVLGGLWNGTDTPPVADPGGANDVRLLRSRSGHEVRLDDTPGAERIEISDGGGKVTIELDTTARTLTLSAESDLTIRSTGGRLRLEGAGVEIASDAGISVQATANLELRGAAVAIN